MGGEQAIKTGALERQPRIGSRGRFVEGNQRNGRDKGLQELRRRGLPS